MLVRVPAVLDAQALARKWYKSDIMQLLIAALILVNFMTTAGQAEQRPQRGTPEALMFENADDIFSALFTLELAWNRE